MGGAYVEYITPSKCASNFWIAFRSRGRDSPKGWSLLIYIDNLAYTANPYFSEWQEITPKGVCNSGLLD